MKKSVFLITMLILAIASFNGCKKDEDDKNGITLNTSSATLYKGETYQISAESPSTITYTSASQYHATVTSTGLVTAGYVGKTNINLSSSDGNETFKLTVAPKSNLYPEANIKIGESASSVKLKYGTPSYEDEDGLGYITYDDNVMYLMVLLENGLVKSITYAISSDYLSELKTFLSERYNYLGYSNSIYLYINSLEPEDTTMLIGRTLYNSSTWWVLYAAPTSKSDMNTLKEKCSALMSNIK